MTPESVLESLASSGKDVTPALEKIIRDAYGWNRKTEQSDFQDWMYSASGSTGKTTLLQEIELAKRLYDEAEGPEDSPVTPEDILAQLHSSPLDQELMEQKGVHTNCFYQTFCQTKYAKRLCDFGCELWFVRKVCMVEFLRRRGVSSGPMIRHMTDMFGSVVFDDSGVVPTVGNPTIFLSYTGSYTFTYFLDCLMLLPFEYVWIDILCVDQFAWTGRSKSKEVNRFRTELIDGLENQIQSIGKTVLMLDKWDNVMSTLEKSWVLWEVFNSVRVNTNFSILLSWDERTRFVLQVTSMIEKFERMRASLEQLDCRNSRAEKTEDRTAIFRRMETAGGFDHVNLTVCTAVRGWFIDSVHLYFMETEITDDDDESIPSICRTGVNISRVLVSLGKMASALKFIDKLLKRIGQECESFSDDIISVRIERAICLLNLDSLHECHQELSLIDPYISRSHPNLLYCKAQARLNIELGRTYDAYIFLRVILSNDQTEYWAWNELAMLYSMGNDPVSAESIYRETIDNAEGNDLVVAKKGLSEVYLRLERFDEAIALLEDVLVVNRKTKGDFSPYTLGIRFLLAKAYAGQSNFQKANELCNDVLEKQRKSSLGQHHPTVFKTLAMRGRLLKQQGNLELAESDFRSAIEGIIATSTEVPPDIAGFIFEEFNTFLTEHSTNDDVEDARRRMVTFFRDSFGDKNPQTIEAIGRLARFLESIGKIQAAVLLRMEISAYCEQSFGHLHCFTLVALGRVAQILALEQRIEECGCIMKDVCLRRSQAPRDDLQAVELQRFETEYVACCCHMFDRGFCDVALESLRNLVAASKACDSTSADKVRCFGLVATELRQRHLQDHEAIQFYSELVLQIQEETVQITEATS